MSLYADILLPVPFDSFTYAIPQELEDKAMRGCRVVVPFGKSKIYTGVIIRTHQNCPKGVEIKDVMEVLDDKPVVNEQQFIFWQWISDYYMSPLGDVFKSALPGAMKPKDEEALRESKRKRRERASLIQEDSMLYNTLNPAQRTAMEEIEEAFKEKDITLLHGVTSSGKTEIYIHLINKYIEQGKQVLYLLPEIALTTQITERLRRVFGDRMGVYHSKFTDVQRLNVYKTQASDTPFDLILGVRSSLFLPFQRLGLIIIDEEHETSYKQQEPAPRYHARNAAMILARQFGAKTLLGTATPSIETYHSARKNRYGYVQLTQRYRDMHMPDIEVVDIKELKRKRMMTGAFSPRLIEDIQNALGRGEQVILFQNRRGFSSFVECRQCGWVPRCPHCDVSLTMHKSTGMLTCHYCGYAMRQPDTCPACNEHKFIDKGTGTEKIEEQLQQIVPQARVLRMDLDTTKTRSQYEKIITQFANHEADILVGTQMVTKGLDFDNVSVVGILDADVMLNQPDFRAYERTFHTLSQVAGRAGRRNFAGHVILQTRNAESNIIKQIAAGDYWQMFYDQMLQRRDFRYPPFCRLIYVYLRHRDQKLLDNLARETAERLRTVFADRVLGPDAPPVSRIQSLYIRKILIKIEPEYNTQQVRNTLNAIQQQMLQQPVAKNLNIYYDIDPM